MARRAAAAVADAAQGQVVHPDPIYRDELNPRFQLNPLVRALPDVPTYEQAYLALVHKPAARDPEFRKQGRNRKLDLIGDLQHIFVPTDIHISALQKIIAVIRECYEARDPNRAEVQARLYRASEGERIGITRLSKTGGGSNGLVLFGITGSGKTSFVDRLVEFIFSVQAGGGVFAHGVIFHKIIQGKAAFWPQIPFVRMQCKTTMKGTVANLFAQLDESLGTTHSARIGRRWNRDIFVELVQQVLSIHFVGLLIVEDAHKLKDSSGVVLEYFCDLMEESGFPILLVATYKFRGVLLADPAIASKLTAKGKIDFPPLAMSAMGGVDHDEIVFDPDWLMFVSRLWSLNVFDDDRKMPEELPRWLHFHTRGVRRLAREMMTHIFERSLRAPETVVDEALLDDISANEMAHYQTPLSALRRQQAGLPITDTTAELFEHFMLPLDDRIALQSDIVIRNEAAARTRKKSPRPSSVKEKEKEKGSNTGEAKQPAKTKAAPKSPRRAPRKPRNTVAETASQVYERLKRAGKTPK